ncbi:hypothetical protein ALC57_10319 [Trachymyrmex cornetzi]|uniref:Uncharacterized protein n=1 Tax=Trachymyrmex cornetzi TaxID=471704 RepID=A0A195DWS8_9HYME|nr:hypothetical protein ALC57_10319 [Trachymyrmex cornetzi]
MGGSKPWSDRVAALGRSRGCGLVFRYLRFRCPIGSVAVSFHLVLRCSRYRRNHHESSFCRWAPTRKRISKTPFVHRG